jgi:hypothetical protein
MNSFIRSPTRAIAPRLPCTEKHCKICDSHFKTEEVIKLDLPTPRPSIWEKWMALSIGDDLLPHLSFIATPERIR